MQKEASFLGRLKDRGAAWDCGFSLYDSALVIRYIAEFVYRGNASNWQRAALHLDYEKLTRWPLTFVENDTVPFSWRSQGLRLSKDKNCIVINESLCLEVIPAETLEYRIANRFVLELVLDQHSVVKDKSGSVISDPTKKMTLNGSV